MCVPFNGCCTHRPGRTGTTSAIMPFGIFFIAFLKSSSMITRQSPRPSDKSISGMRFNHSIRASRSMYSSIVSPPVPGFCCFIHCFCSITQFITACVTRASVPKRHSFATPRLKMSTYQKLDFFSSAKRARFKFHLLSFLRMNRSRCICTL